MEHQEPWAVFGDVVREVTRPSLDQVRILLQERTAQSDARLIGEIRAVRGEVAQLRRQLGQRHAVRDDGGVLPWLIAAACATGDVLLAAFLFLG